MCGFPNSGGCVNFKSEGKFHPRDAGITRCYAFVSLSLVVKYVDARWLPLEFATPLAEGVPDVVWWVVFVFVFAQVGSRSCEPSGVEDRWWLYS